MDRTAGRRESGTRSEGIGAKSTGGQDVAAPGRLVRFVPVHQRRPPRLTRQLERHLASSILTGVGVTLLAAGLFAYVLPFGATATAPATPPATQAAIVSFPPTALPSAASPATAPSAATSAAPSPTPKPAVATRVVVPALGIDLPILPGTAKFPYCNVAQYLPPNPSLPFTPVQPGQDGTTYLYAHARVGMFLPLLNDSMIDNGSGMIGFSVLVYTSDSKVYWYSISRVKRHVPPTGSGTWEIAKAPAGVKQLVLQTSEGPYESSTKLQVLAKFELVQTATYAASHPTPHPIICS